MGNTNPTFTPRRPSQSCTTSISWQRCFSREASVFDYYEIGELLGSGTFGQVRACWPAGDSSQEFLAVKIVDTKSEVFRQARGLITAWQEANVLKALKHPNIVELRDVFEKENMLFIVLERIAGGELFEAF